MLVSSPQGLYAKLKITFFKRCGIKEALQDPFELCRDVLRWEEDLDPLRNYNCNVKVGIILGVITYMFHLHTLKNFWIPFENIFWIRTWIYGLKTGKITSVKLEFMFKISQYCRTGA